uniref:CUB domain-containing protein n=1 Tax=Syphacia muris TaxID=451379 RepID=A0A0N5AKX9_9BILA
MNGSLEFTLNDTLLEKLQKVDSSFDMNTYHSFLVPAYSKLAFSYYPDQKSLEWMGINILTISANIGDQKCPYDEYNNANRTVQNMFILSDYYNANETRNYTKQCSWTIPAPENGNISILQLLNTDLHEGESLQILGSINGTETRSVYDSSSEIKSEVKYYDGVIQINYIRAVPIQSELPAFRLFVRRVPVVEKSCSLGYNNNTYQEEAGMFTNDAAGLKYQPNDDCLWHLFVPENRTAEFCCTYHQYGPLSGDSFTVHAFDKQILDCSKDDCVTLNYTDESYLVDFVWKSDGASEYNGFTVSYELVNIYPGIMCNFFCS